MKNSETPEMFLINFFNSVYLKKLAIILVLTGITICIIPLLPPVQNILFSFIKTYISRKGSGGIFESRLWSLLSLPFFGLVVFIFALFCLFSQKINLFLKNAKNTNQIIIFTIGIIIVLIGYIVFFSYQYGWQWLNSDHSSEMVLGKLLAHENAFVSRNWHYSTEIRLVYQTIFSMPLFKLFISHENWALIRSLTIFFNNIILFLSYLFMAKQIKIQEKWIWITSIFLFMPISSGYWDIVIFGGYYIFFIAQLFCCLGLFIKLICNVGTVKTILPGFVLFTILSFVLGIQGIRSLLCITIPILLVSRPR